MVTENEQKLNDILKKLVAHELVPETLSETRGTNSRGNEVVVKGKWRLGDLLFGYEIQEGRKYGTATVEQEGSDVTFDLTGCGLVLRDIVFSLRFPQTRSRKKASKQEEVK